MGICIKDHENEMSQLKSGNNKIYIEKRITSFFLVVYK